MCYSNCKHENFDGECVKRKNTPYDADCHCFEEEEIEETEDDDEN